MWPTNMYDMSIGVQHYIAVVSVFNLQQETNNTVRCHGSDKVSSGVLKTQL